MTALLVTDAEPLIVLARADALHALLRHASIVLVPDMVRTELIYALARPGAQPAVDWIRENESSRLRVVSTEAFEEFVVLRRERPATKVAKRGEQAAAEVLAREHERGTPGVTLLVADANAGKKNFLVPLPEGVRITYPADILLPAHSALSQDTFDRWIWAGERNFVLANQIVQDFPDMAAYHYQQAAATFLMAFLSLRQVPLRRNCSIGTLALMCSNLDAAFTKLVNLADVDAIAEFENRFRYPNEECEDFPTATDLAAAKSFCEIAREIVIDAEARLRA